MREMKQVCRFTMLLASMTYLAACKGSQPVADVASGDAPERSLEVTSDLGRSVVVRGIAENYK